MRQTLLTGVVAAAALIGISTAPASACGGLFQSGIFQSGGCSPCGYAAPAPVSPCGGVAVGGYYGYGVADEYERLPDPSPQYFYVNQGPTYSGAGMFAPAPYYREATVSTGYGYGGGYYRGHRHHPQFRAWHGHRGHYGVRPGYRYGYGARPFYGAPRMYHGARPNLRYGMPHGAPRYSGVPRGYSHPGMHHRR